MGWSLDYHKPKDPALLDDLFLSVGKALYVASEFERKCHYVLGIAKFVHLCEQTRDVSAVEELLKNAKNGTLGRAIKELGWFPEIQHNSIDLLEKAKDARNYVAHQCAALGPLSSISREEIRQRIVRLSRELESLIEGDNLVSRWVYEIEEKEPAPREIQKEYPKWIRQWIFPNALIDRQNE